MPNVRPDPDALLASLKQEEARAQRGKLKVFLGMCPGVGKTYAMLRAAQQERAAGIDVVVGVVETHGRAETQAMLTGLTLVPRKTIEHRGTTVTEMDLEAIRALQPRIVLVDELAHTNAPGSRHAKRWQDVLELLDAGIEVFTTLNIQHVESRADAVRQITGAPVHETVPDSLLDLADELELLDLTSEALLERLREGKVYLATRPSASSGSCARCAPARPSRPCGAAASGCSWQWGRARFRRSSCAGRGGWRRPSARRGWRFMWRAPPPSIRRRSACSTKISRSPASLARKSC
jgi:two-component system sensor histidine kinase KdpD